MLQLLCGETSKALPGKQEAPSLSLSVPTTCKCGSGLYPSHNQVALSLTYTTTTACERYWGRGLNEPWPMETLGQWIVMVKAHSFEAVCYTIVDNGYQGIAGLNTCFNYGNLLFVCVPPHMQWCVCGGYQEDSFWEWILFPSITWILAVSRT